MFRLRSAIWRAASKLYKQGISVDTMQKDVKKYFNIKPTNINAFYKYYHKDVEEIWSEIGYNYPTNINFEDKLAYCIEHLLVTGDDE